MCHATIRLCDCYIDSPSPCSHPSARSCHRWGVWISLPWCCSSACGCWRASSSQGIPQQGVTARNPHAASELAGAENGVTAGSTRARTGKPGIRTRPGVYGPPSQRSTLPGTSGLRRKSASRPSSPLRALASKRQWEEALQFAGSLAFERVHGDYLDMRRCDAYARQLVRDLGV
jgi:hypothetical protein